MKKLYIVTVVAQRAGIARVWITMITIAGTPDFSQVTQAIITQSYRNLPPQEEWVNHTVSTICDISDEARAFAAQG